jgi:alginate O-acetyltransferase complex protein AlgI
LGGNKAVFFGIFPLFVAWGIMGLWHGAAWHFVLWGVYWIIIIMIYRIVKRFIPEQKPEKRFSKSVAKILSIISLFHITCYGWIIFRAQSIRQIINMTSSLFTGIAFTEFLNSSYFFLYAIMLFLLVYEIILYKKKDQLFIYRKNFYYQLVFYIILFFLFIEIGAVHDVRFLYFQF